MTISKTTSFKKCKLKALCYLSHFSTDCEDELNDLVDTKIDRLEKLNLETTRFRNLIENASCSEEFPRDDIEYYYKKLVFQTEYALASREISYKMYKLILVELGRELQGFKLNIPVMKDKKHFQQKVKQRRYRHQDLTPRKKTREPEKVEDEEEESVKNVEKEPEISNIGYYCHFCFTKSESVAQVLCENGCESIMCINCEHSYSCPICQYELVDVKSVDDDDAEYSAYEYEKYDKKKVPC